MELNDIQKAAQLQFGKQSERYGRGHILENVEDVRQALTHIRLPEKSRALDVATGGGHTGLFLAGLGFEVTLSDVAQPMLDRVEKSASERKLSISTAQHPAEAFPFPDQSFDLVTCRVAPHHFSDVSAFIGETARVLRQGGYLLLIDGSVEDNEPEAEAWIHEVEKLRDPSHHRLVTPGRWTQLCQERDLRVIVCELSPMKQPDLDWYFETANTPPENRRRVLELVESAPANARRLFKLCEEDGKIIWWWQRLTLIAVKN